MGQTFSNKIIISTKIHTTLRERTSLLTKEDIKMSTEMLSNKDFKVLR